jgi:hypothetical protein
MLQFKTAIEMFEFIKEKLQCRVMPNAEYASLKKKTKFFLFTDEGRNILRANRFYYVKEVREKVSVAFAEEFKCDKCKYEGCEGDVCRTCAIVQHILKSM